MWDHKDVYTLSSMTSGIELQGTRRASAALRTDLGIRKHQNVI